MSEQFLEHDTLPAEQQGEVVVMPARKCPYCGAIANFNRTNELGGGGTPLPAGAERPGTGDFHSFDVCQACNAVVYYRSDKSGSIVIDQYPRGDVKPPQGLPEGIEKAFREALICYASGAPNGALLMCRRALQETLNNLEAPRGQLPAQLEALVSNRTITPKLKEWADQARIGGRIAAHGEGGGEWGDPSKIWGTLEDAKVVIEYLQSFFEYAYLIEHRLGGTLKKQIQPASQSGTGSNAK